MMSSNELSVPTVGIVEWIAFLEQTLRSFYSDVPLIDRLQQKAIHQHRVNMLHVPSHDACSNGMFASAHANPMMAKTAVDYVPPVHLELTTRLATVPQRSSPLRASSTLTVTVRLLDAPFEGPLATSRADVVLLHLTTTRTDGSLTVQDRQDQQDRQVCGQVSAVAKTLAHVDAIVERCLAYLRRMNLAPIHGVAYAVDSAARSRVARVPASRHPVLWEHFPHTFLQTRDASSLEPRTQYIVGTPVHAMQERRLVERMNIQANMPSYAA